MPALMKRLAIGLVGQGVWRVAVALNTVALIPVLIATWGLEGYGQWMTINALVSYLAYANLGLVAAATNELIMLVAAGDQVRAQRCFQMSCNLALGPFPILLAAILALAASLPLVDWFNLAEFSSGAVLLILALGALQLCCETLRGFMAGVLFSAGRYGAAYNIAAGVKFVELGASIYSVGVLGVRPVYLAAITAAVALVDLIIVVCLARSAAPWARLDFRVMDGRFFRDQLKPALGFACFNLATQGVLVQGPRLVLGTLMGGPAVAVYAVYATAMRLVDQLFFMLMAPVGVEISHAAGRGEPQQVVRLTAVIVQLSTLVLIAVTSFLMVLGPVIFDWWTHSRVAFHHPLMALFLVMSAASLPGRIAAQVLISVNAMRIVSVLVLAVSLASLVLGSALVPNFKIYGMLIGPICGEVAIAVVLWICLNRWLGLPLSGIAREVADVSGLVKRIQHHLRAPLGGRGGSR
ncbi:lipopolysaccharide biosynthesis protein [Bradyrhizobium symbiodeficiens]|uniref:lipopolysaccharide biosynthesis protein n=1 Tax=Bradyrhizobium symbiodeficiens TaxID=1404367 RepID=UPI00140F63E6|nr:hypothetical protein [Bradyrhizobium symbiodeficiens]QIO98796.1 hypothetical protein HAU86_02760 [Bradyrhizobium symbiodeficiens]